jgi:hypothetical protein
MESELVELTQEVAQGWAALTYRVREVDPVAKCPVCHKTLEVGDVLQLCATTAHRTNVWVWVHRKRCAGTLKAYESEDLVYWLRPPQV